MIDFGNGQECASTAVVVEVGKDRHRTGRMAKGETVVTICAGHVDIRRIEVQAVGVGRRV